MFSTTTIASSTAIPTASTRPNSVRLLIEKSKAAITAKVPTSEIGMATIGMTAARQDCRNRSTTMTTSSIASKIVTYTSCTDCSMNFVGLKAIVAATPDGRSCSISCRRFSIERAVSSAFEPGRWKMGTGSAVLPSR